MDKSYSPKSENRSDFKIFKAKPTEKGPLGSRGLLRRTILERILKKQVSTLQIGLIQIRIGINRQTL